MRFRSLRMRRPGGVEPPPTRSICFGAQAPTEGGGSRASPTVALFRRGCVNIVAPQAGRGDPRSRTGAETEATAEQEGRAPICEVAKPQGRDERACVIPDRKKPPGWGRLGRVIREASNRADEVVQLDIQNSGCLFMPCEP